MKFNRKIIGVLVIGLAIALAVAVIIYSPIIRNISFNSPLTTENRELSGYHNIYFSGIGEVELIQTGQYGLQISAIENIIPDIETTVENQTLKIQYKWDWRKNNLRNQRPIKILIQVADLEKIEISGAGSLISSKLKADQLDISINGASQASLYLEVETLNSTITGAGQITVTGISNKQTINISGAGNYSAKGLQSEDATVIITGLGTAKVTAKENLGVNISGGGKVVYSGNPKISRQISGLGSVSHD